MWPWSEIKRLNECIESRENRIRDRDAKITRLESDIRNNIEVLKLEQEVLKQHLYIITLEEGIKTRHPNDNIVHDCYVLYKKLLEISRKQKELNK